MLFNEIFLPILEMRHATLRQKSLLLSVYQRLCQDPQALVEIYINYDCDRTAIENIYERLTQHCGADRTDTLPATFKGRGGRSITKPQANNGSAWANYTRDFGDFVSAEARPRRQSTLTSAPNRS